MNKINNVYRYVCCLLFFAIGISQIIAQGNETGLKNDSRTLENMFPTDREPEQFAQYPGGDVALLRFIKTNLNYPEQSRPFAIHGKVYVRFIVSENGDVKDPRIIRSPLDVYCNKEALRIIKIMPKWIPAKTNGANVPMKFVIPIEFIAPKKIK